MAYEGHCVGFGFGLGGSARATTGGKTAAVEGQGLGEKENRDIWGHNDVGIVRPARNTPLTAYHTALTTHHLFSDPEDSKCYFKKPPGPAFNSCCCYIRWSNTVRGWVLTSRRDWASAAPCMGSVPLPISSISTRDPAFAPLSTAFATCRHPRGIRRIYILLSFDF